MEERDAEEALANGVEEEAPRGKSLKIVSLFFGRAVSQNLFNLLPTFFSGRGTQVDDL